MKKLLFQILMILTGTTFLVAVPKLGVNLTNDGAFVDIVKHTNRYQDVESFDEWGWPNDDFTLVLMDGRPVAEWAGQIDDPERYRVDYSGRYKASFRGRADLSLWGSGASIENIQYDDTEYLTTFDLVLPAPPGDNHGIVSLTFSNTIKSPQLPVNSGISYLKVHRPNYPLDTDKVFTDEFLALCKAANFDCYRFYNLQNIWSGEPTYPEVRRWEQRKLPGHAAQVSMAGTLGNPDGWSWEYIIELANILGKDIWICLHLSMNEDYVKDLAQMLKDNLDQEINIYIENSNELWSPTHMTHGPYNQAEAEELGLSFQHNHARRTLLISQWFAEVFGQEAINNKIRVVMAGQHAWFDRHKAHLSYFEDLSIEPKDHIYALSTALYFNTTLPEGTPTEIVNGMKSNIQSQISDNTINTYRQRHIDLAAEYELVGGCTSYEGGPHFPAGGSPENLDNAIIAHRTDDMAATLKMNYVQGWDELGGGLAMHFTLSSAYTRYGCWGLTDDYTNPDRNYKMQAIREMVGEWQDPDNTAVERLNNLPLVVFPNPSQGTISLELAEDMISSYYNAHIYNSDGKLVHIHSGIPKNIDISHLPLGQYYITIRSLDTIRSTGFLKE